MTMNTKHIPENITEEQPNVFTVAFDKRATMIYEHVVVFPDAIVANEGSTPSDQ